MRILVITISDRAFRGEYEDRSGPVVAEVLADLVPGAEIERVIVPDERERIERALEEGLDGDLIVTTGGTGLGPRDVTPDVTGGFCDRIVPGIAEMLRAGSLEQTPTAALSRATAGLKGNTLIVNLPGSRRGAEFCARLLAPILPHAAAMIRGEEH